MEIEKKEAVSRWDFLKLGLAGLSVPALLFLSGCGGGGEDDEGDEDGGDEDD